MSLLKGRFGGARVALLSLIGVAAVGFAGYKFFFERTGEAAVALIPSDASIVVTLDTHPSENQIAAFKKLGDALKREGLDKQLESGVNDLVGKAGLAGEVRQHLTHNMASAWWQGQGNHALGLFSIDNPSEVAQLLTSGTSVPGAGLPTYSFAKSPMVCAVVGDYLAIASDADTINRVESTRKGAPSVASLAEYRTARAALPADANVMVFVSPSALHEAIGKDNASITTWLSLGASLRDGGIQFDYRGPVDRSKWPEMASLAGMPPLPDGLLKKLPPDAYGLLAYSSFDRIMSATKSSAQKIGGDTVDKSISDFERETGLSVENDVLPAFKGDLVLAVYPSSNSVSKTPDGMVLVDDANGGNPAALAEKVRALLERKSAEESAKSGKPPVKFLENKVGEVTTWELDENSANELRGSLGSGGSPESKPNEAVKDKNIAYAVCKGSVVVASSRAMLTKAILTLNGDRSLADDPAFAEMATHVNPKDQGMIMCALTRVVQEFGGDMHDENSGITRDDWINLFGGPGTGLVGSGRVEGDASRATLFLPLDFDRMAKIVKAAMKGFSRHSEPSQEIENKTA